MSRPGGRLATLCGFAAVNSVAAAFLAQSAAVFPILTDRTIPRVSNIYSYMLVRYEPLALDALAIFFAALGWALWRQKTPGRPSPILTWQRLAPVLALVVLAVTILGRFEVHMNFDFSIDEYLNKFEARIMDHHHLVATVSPEWRDEARAMKVPYENYNAHEGYWASGFLPGFAAIDFLFVKARVDWALNPLLAAGSILLLAALARRVFPHQALPAANIAILLLAFSPQFLAMALAKFAWTAHLAGTLLWAWLYTHPRRALFYLTPVLGALMIGLHQPHVPALVAAPFVLRLARDRQWRDFGWFVLCYGIGACAWYPVYTMLRPGGFEAGSDLNNLLPGHSFQPLVMLLSVMFAVFHAVTLMAWTCPAMIPFFALFLSTWRTQPTFLRDSVWAAALTFCFYLTFPHPQGHGWGYRYLHPVYGLLALAAAGGALSLWRKGLGGVVSKTLLASLAFSLLVQIPYRSYQIRTLVRPLALTARFLSMRPTEFVLIRTADFWYSWDLIRNDPWLQQRPILFYEERLTAEQRAEIASRGTVTVITAKDVAPFGVILSDPSKPPVQ